MNKVARLSVGFLCEDGIYDEVIKEISNHQGLLYEEIINISNDHEKFPCIILPKYTDEKYELARKNCVNEDGILILEEEIPLNMILKALSGQLEAPYSDSLYPIINQYEVDLVAKIKEKYANLGLPLIRKWFWPHSYNACCVMTHDVDWLYYSPWHRVVWRKKSIPRLMKLVWQSIFHKKNYGNNIFEIARKEDRRKIKSSFFFLTRYEKNYQKEFLKHLRELKEKEFEVGLHGYYSHDNLDRLKEQKAILEKYTKREVKGVRQHELNFLTPLTWKYEEEAGFMYDLTFCYNDKFGFRAGICFPYHSINISENRRFSIIEMPTCFMDWTVLFKKMSHEEALQMFLMLKGIVEKFNGLLLMCFHNTYQNEDTFPEMDKLYSTILDSLTQRKYWVTTANKCCQWWLRREKAKIDAKIRGKSIIGKTTTYPLPLIIENVKGERKHVEVREEQFEFILG